MSESRPDHRSIRTMDVFILAGLALVSVWPLPLHFSASLPALPADLQPTLIPGDGDPYMFCWNLWWVSRFLEGTDHLLDCGLLHYPFGVSLSGHTLSVTHGIIGFLPMIFMETAAVHNILLVFNAFLTGYAVYWMVMLLGGTRSWAFFGSCVSVLWPSRMIHSCAHLNLSATGWVALAAATLLYSCRTGRFRWSVISGFSGAAAAGCDWFHAVGLMFILPTIASISCHGKVSSHVIKMMVSMGLMILIVSPLAVPLLSSDPLTVTRDIVESRDYSLRIPSFFVPSPLHSLWGRLVIPYYKSLPGNPVEAVGYMGMVTLPIGMAGLLKNRGGSRRWLFTGFILGLMALGPSLNLGRWHIPMPFALFRMVPGMSFSRTPSRLWIYAGIMIATGAALFCAHSRRRLANRSIALVASALVLLDFASFPIPTTRISLDRTLDSIPLPAESFVAAARGKPSGAPDRTAVLDIPSDWNCRKYMWSQQQHQRPIPLGFVSRMPPGYFIRRDDFPLFKSVSRPDTGWTDILQSDPVGWRDLQLLLGIKYFVLHRTRYMDLSPQNLDIFSRKSGSRLLASDQETAVFEVMEREALVDGEGYYSSPAVRTYYYRNWHGPETWGDTKAPVRWVEGRSASVALIHDFPGQVPAISLEVISAPGIHAQNIHVSCNGNQIFKMSATREFQKMEMMMPSGLQPGMNELKLDMSDAVRPADFDPGSDDHRLISVAIRNLQVVK